MCKVLLLLLACSASKLWVEDGTPATLSVAGDTEDGCKFLRAPAGIIDCCYSAATRGDQLCDPAIQSATCREPAHFNMTEEPGMCILWLPEFRVMDSAIYRAIFPAQLAANKDIDAEAFRPWRSWQILLVVIVVILIVTMVVAFVFVFVWKPYTIQKREEPENDEKIMDALCKMDKETFQELSVNRNILKVLDAQQNSVLHLAANSDWNDEMTQMLEKKMRKTARPEFQDEEEGVQITFSREDIFTAHPIPTSCLIFMNFIEQIPALSSKWFKPTVTGLDCQNLNGETPLIIACSHNQQDVVRVLLQENVDIDLQDNTCQNALHHAVKNGFFGIAQQLLGAHETWRPKRMELVFLAAVMGREDIVDLLITRGANNDDRWRFDDGSGEPIILRAVDDRNHDAVKLIRKKVDKEKHKTELASALKLAKEARRDVTINGENKSVMDEIIITLTPRSMSNPMKGAGANAARAVIR